LKPASEKVAKETYAKKYDLKVHTLSG